MTIKIPRHQNLLAPILALAAITLGACGGGGGGGPPPAGREGDGGGLPPQVAFITSATGTGDLSSWPEAGVNSGVAAGDAICQTQAQAQAAGLAGTYVAWLSDANDDAYCRVLGLSGKKSANCGQATLPVNAGPWVRTDGFPFSGTLDQLTTDSVIYAPLRHDEFGAEVAGIFFTATDHNGVLNQSRTSCANWTAANVGDIAGAGGTEATAAFWTDSFGVPCSANLRLACFATGAGGELPPFTTPGKTVFMTSVSGTGDLGSWPDAGGNIGLAAGDTICQVRAQSAGLTGAFKAWLSDSANNAVNRLTSSGPWVRLDGVKIADDKTDLTDGKLFTAVGMDETGTYTLFNGSWTGTDISGNKTVFVLPPPDLPEPLQCNNWQSSLATDQGTWGSALLADNGWTDNAVATCNAALTLLCFED